MNHQSKDRNTPDDSPGAWQPFVQKDPFQPLDSTTNQSRSEHQQESLQYLSSSGKPTDLSQKPAEALSFFADWVKEDEEEHGDSHHENYDNLSTVITEVDQENDEEEEDPMNSVASKQRTLRAETATDLVGCPIQLVVQPIGDDQDHQDTQNNIYISHEQEDARDVEKLGDESEQSVDPVLNLQAEEILFKAMTETTRATNLLEEKEYLYALDAFDTAIGFYKEIMKTSGMAVVNSANCYRNMASISLKLQSYDDAVEYFRQAVVFYNQARIKLLMSPNVTRKPESVATMDGKLLDDSNALPDESCFQDDVLSLDTIIVQTLQQQANILIKCKEDLEGATVCHEMITRHLVDMASQKQFVLQSTIEWEGISYTTMTEDEHSNYLGQTLQTLGSYYTESLEHSKTLSLVLYEEALDVLQTRLERYPHYDPLIHSVSLVLRYLSEIYFIRHEIERSVDALHDSMAVKLSASGEPDAEALKIMDKMGAANEKSGNWEKARSCFEQSLVARCQFYGKTSLCVAKTLANLGRVAEKQNNGPTDESSELLKAANSIYALYVKALASPILSREVDDIIQHVPEVTQESDREQKTHKDNEELEVVLGRDMDNKDDRDRAQIYFDLGRSYMSAGNLKMAKTCLISAIKEADHGDECELHSVLQSLEFVDEQETPAEKVKSSLDLSIQSLGTILSYGKTEFSEVQFSDLPMEKAQYVDCLTEASNDEPSWANFSVHTDARNWKKPAAEEEKTSLGEDGDLENDPNYNILYESFRMESSDRTPKVGNVAANRLVVQTASRQDMDAGTDSNIRGFGIFSCWQTKTENPGQSRKSSPASSTRKTTVKRKIKQFVTMVRQSTTVPFIRKDDDSKESQHLLLTANSSGDDTLAVSSFDDSPISACLSPTSRQWRTGSSTPLGLKEKKRNHSHRRAFI